VSVDLSDFLPAYLTEVEELLSAANAHLLSLETAVRQRSASPRTVRELFRALHTIKGLSAMVDVEPIVSIAHGMETALRHADQAGGRLSEASIEPMMEGLRAIEQRVRQLAAGTPVSEAPRGLLERLEGMEGPAGGGARQQEASTTLQLEPALAAKLTASRPGGARSGWTTCPRPGGPPRGSPSTACASASASWERSSR
jgi:two-component system chemotaxis sensor kinase CheA